jgi:hypothetical protein
MRAQKNAGWKEGKKKSKACLQHFSTTAADALQFTP